jgi:predicted esterase YcpF (UPF0227 family)
MIKSDVVGPSGACLDEKKQCVVYLHGFNSSGNAQKSQILQAAIGLHAPELAYYSPTLIHHPEKAISELQAYLDQQATAYNFCFVGSSLGGFFAIYFANRYLSSKAVLINPAIRAWESMHKYYGHYENPVTGEKFEVTENFVTSLKAFSCLENKSPERFLLLLQTDDDVIDHRIALKAFPDSRHIVRTGGGHTFTDFLEVIPCVLQFIGKSA